MSRQSEKIEHLEKTVKRLQKDVSHRDVVIANLNRERVRGASIRSQLRRLLGTIDRRVLGVFADMKHREKIDRSKEARQILVGIENQSFEGARRQIARHDVVAYVAVYEPHTFKSRLGQVLHSVYSRIRSMTRTVVFSMLRTLKKVGI